MNKLLGGRGSELIVVVFTSRHVLGSITVEGEIVKDGAFGASRDGWVLALHAEVEAAAVIGLDVPGVIEDVAIGVDLGGVGASEAIVKDLNSLSASSSDASVFPLAGASEFVEDESS